MPKETKERKNTPVGYAMWAHLRTPKEGYVDPNKPNSKPGPEKYVLEVAFDPSNREWAEWFNDLKERYDKAGYKNEFWRPEKDSDGAPTGRTLVRFDTYAKNEDGSDRRKPPIYNKDGVDETDKDYLIGNGSKVRVNYTESEYSSMGGGFKLYLNAVQVLELLEYKPEAPPASAYGFDENKEAVAAAKAEAEAKAADPF